jgi:hypothetical protein
VSALADSRHPASLACARATALARSAASAARLAVGREIEVLAAVDPRLLAVRLYDSGLLSQIEKSASLPDLERADAILDAERDRRVRA